MHRAEENCLSLLQNTARTASAQQRATGTTSDEPRVPLTQGLSVVKELRYFGCRRNGLQNNGERLSLQLPT